MRLRPVQTPGMNTDFAEPAAPVRKKSRWWVWVLVAFGGLICLAVLGLIAVYFYYQSLVRNFTAASPRPMPKLEVDPRRQKALEAKWAEFSQAIRTKQSPAPFVITADDINAVLAQNKQLRNMVRFVITNDQLVAQFSAPLDQSGRPELKGRYLNGEARVNLVFQDGWLSASVGSVEANGRKMPGWLLKGLQRENLLKDLERKQETVNLLHEIESIRIQDGQIVLTPLPPMR
jgi:hypothetical protein